MKAEEAQTVAEIRERNESYGVGSLQGNADIRNLLEIVDSQAQTIAEQRKEIVELNEQLESAFEDGYDRFDGRNRSVKGATLVP